MSAVEEGPSSKPLLNKLSPSTAHTFSAPVKRIHDGPDVSFFLTSTAYEDIVTFMLQLNRSMVPRRVKHDGQDRIETWPLGSDSTIPLSKPVRELGTLITKLESFIAEAPPDTGPRRFGNVSFRKWYNIVESQIDELLPEHLSSEVLSFGSSSPVSSDGGNRGAAEELVPYLLGSFGSPQRLDYGTGHELSFLAFLGCLWKLGAFESAGGEGVEERGIVLGVFEPYLNLIRQLIKIYNLEPAGSHGVWGLDDNSFLPYVFGSAQLSPAITESEETPIEGSLPDAPDTSAVTKREAVERERSRNMYFSAIGFIYDIKRGPFWEHSPMLFDISGVRAGWGKINKGMIKMYNAEVLSKFPVVQHFPFGSLFKWEKDPEAIAPTPTTHASSQPLRNPHDANQPVGMRPPPAAGTAAPWSSGAATLPPAGTAAPWAKPTSKPPPGMVDGVTRAPWANQAAGRLPGKGSSIPTTRAPPLREEPDSSSAPAEALTKAPWARKTENAPKR